MQFKHPEILFTLFLLIIPIIVHLFQLQRFIKVPFTNVKFLKQIALQTRKSSKLKKWLVLLSRLALFTSFIFAFSQPYFSNKINKETNHTILYLDNSFSMQSQNNGMELFKKSIQEIISNSEKIDNFSLITNDQLISNLDSKSLKEALLELEYSVQNPDFQSIFLKYEQIKANEPNTLHNVILISDFQDISNINKPHVTNVTSPVSLINVGSTEFKNIYIDSAYVISQNSTRNILKVIVKNVNISSENTSISLFNDEDLIGKASTPLLKNLVEEVEFEISTTGNFNGIIVIEDENLPFDNILYFNLSNNEKTNAISIGKKASFLSKIFLNNEFNYSESELNNLDYIKIQNQNLVILNELDKIPPSLTNVLKQYTSNGGTIIIIPSDSIDISNYNSLFEEFKMGEIISSDNRNLKINKLNFEHPILKDVFEKRIDNFQYPSTNHHYNTSLNQATHAVNIENGSNFISRIKYQKGTIYWFSSSLDAKVSNFKNSPIIVPIFYNIGKSSFQNSQLYYTIGKNHEIDIRTEVTKNDVLKLSNESLEFIPLQQVFQKNVRLNFAELPNKSGLYQLKSNNDTIKTLAFNFDRIESIGNYTDLDEIFGDYENITISDSIEETLKKLNNQQQNKPLFRWFLIASILFLLLEICILKFYKV